MSKDGLANAVTKHRLRESLAWRTNSEMKNGTEKSLSLQFMHDYSFHRSCMITVNFCKPVGSTACGRTSPKGRTANLSLLEAQQGQWAPQAGLCPQKLLQSKGWRKPCNHKMSTRGGREETPTPAVIKTLEKPLCCCPFHRAPALSPTFCRRQTALKIRPL